jgi:chemotaxis methyl-accepting protein methylase
VGRLGALGALLVKQGYTLKLFCSDIRNDPPVVEELGRILREDELGRSDAAGSIQRVHQWTTEELLTNMASMEFVITSRFETIVFAQILNIPVLAISGQPEVKALMNHLELGEFCVDSEEGDLDGLAAKFSSLVNRRNELKRLMAEKLASDKRGLAIRFDKLFPPELGQVASLSRADNPKGLLEITRKSLRRRVEQLQQWPRALFITIVLLMVALVGFVDYATGFEAFVSVFYLPAIGLAAWFVGRGFAIFISILSVIVSLLADLAGGAPFSGALLPTWNASILLAIYFVVVGLLAIARSLQQEAEGQVQQRAGPAFWHGQTSRLARRLLSTKSATAGFWTPSMANCITTALLMIGLVGFLDYVTGTEVSCSAFYLPAVGLAVWFVGAGFALFVSVLSVAVSLSPGLAGGTYFSKPLVATWNASILLSTYFIVVGLLAYVRSLQQQVRARVSQADATVVAPLQPPSKATPSGVTTRLTPRPCSGGKRWTLRLMEIPALLLMICRWLCVSLGTLLFMAYLAVSRRIWAWLPTSVRARALGRAYGRHLHSVVCRFAGRNQNHSTFFLRNRAELELLCRLVNPKTQGSSLNMTIFACSKGAEVYSFLWAIRSARPDLNLCTRAVDISQEVLEFAKRGVYSLRSHEALKNENEPCVSTVSAGTWKDQPSSIFERMTQKEMEEMFEQSGNEANVRSWLKQGITWQTGDAADPEIVRAMGPQDVVVANRFLCHMAPEAAEKCLRNIARVVKPGGYLFVSGVDLRVRTRVARSLGWKPVDDLLQEVYEGDVSLRNGWPFGWWGVEPFSHDLPDWRIQYASVFQVGETP